MRFEELTEQQLLALAISLEEEDGRIYRDFAESFRADYAAAAELFTRLADEESQHLWVAEIRSRIEMIDWR